MAKKVLSFFILLSVLSLFAGCYFPQPPDYAKIFQQIDQTQGDFTVYYSGVHPQWPIGRNAIFLAADDVIQEYYKNQIAAVYNNPNIRLEDITWWKFAPVLAKLYDQVIVLNYNQVRYRNLMDAINYAEKQYGVYDLYILSHGIPNHLTSGKGYFLSWKELKAMEGQLKRLNMVFMQACYGMSLYRDWFDAGANAVIAFEDENRNFFYIDYFLDYFGKYHYNGRQTHERVMYDMKRKLDADVVARKIIGAVGFGSVEEYLSVAKDPFYLTPR